MAGGLQLQSLMVIHLGGDDVLEKVFFNCEQLFVLDEFEYWDCRLQESVHKHAYSNSTYRELLIVNIRTTVSYVLIVCSQAGILSFCRWCQ